MASMTGKAGAVLIAAAGGSAAAINGKVTDWDLDYSSVNVEANGAGDTVTERVHIRKDWTINAKAIFPDQAARGAHEELVGASVIISVKQKSADTNPYATCATALLESCRPAFPATDVATYDLVIKSSGTDLTFDSTPA